VAHIGIFARINARCKRFGGLPEVFLAVYPKGTKAAADNNA
jgi:hypothetical protein